MKAVGQERRSAAHPPSHPSGQKIGGDGTWGEGRPPFAETGPTSTAPDKRGSSAPAIAIGGASGEAPAATTTSLPDKRGGSAPQAMLGGPGTEGLAEGGRPAPAELRDPCAKTPAIHAEGSQQAREGAPEAPPSSGIEVACRRGQVHSAAAGRSEMRTVPSAAAPDGAFTVLTGEAAKSPPQGPAGGFADAPQKSEGYGTERIDVGTCAPQDPSMTVRMPPSHPAMGAAPRQRPTSAVPAFGARAALTASRDDDVGTKAPRGLGVSQVHLSGPMLYPGPRLPQTDSLAEAPSGSLADDSAPAGQRKAAAPSGTAGAGQAKGVEAEGLVTPTAAQAAASARGGGGGGGLTAAQQHATNAIRMDEIKGEVRVIEQVLPTYTKAADDAREKLKPLEKAHDEYREAVLRKEAAERVYNEMAFGTGENAINDPSDPEQIKAKAAFEDATREMGGKEAQQKGYKEAKKEADEKNRKYEEKRRQDADLDEEQQNLNAKNRKLEDGMSPTEKARAEKDKERLKRDQDRQREIQDRLEERRERREERNKSRPDYRATQRAKARRAGNKLSKSLAKAKKLLKIAQNPNLSAKARKSALAKAKTQIQKAKQAALDKLDALDKANASDGEVKEAEKELEEVERLEREIDEAEEDLEEEDQEPPPPCLLPCACNIPCESPDRCVCSRQRAGGTPVPEGGGGGAAEPTPPDVLIPEGSTAADEGSDGGEEGADEVGRKGLGSGGGGGRRGSAGPAGGGQFPDGVYFQQGDGGGGRGGGAGGGQPKTWEDEVREYAQKWFAAPPPKKNKTDPDPRDDCKEKAKMILAALKWAKTEAKYARGRNYDDALTLSSAYGKKRLGGAIDDALLLGMLAQETSFGDPSKFQLGNVDSGDYGPFQIRPDTVTAFNEANGTRFSHRDMGNFDKAAKVASWLAAYEVQQLTVTTLRNKDGTVRLTQGPVTNADDAKKMALAAYNAGGPRVLEARENARDAAVQVARAKKGKDPLTPAEISAIREKAGNTYAEIAAYLPETTRNHVRRVLRYADLVLDCRKRVT